jgi:tetratricopeptide (TPR) repeat protein
VQVLGTRFTVALREVSVERGRVRVVAPDGREVRVLVAGQRYSVADGGNVLAPVAPLVHEAHEANDTDEAHGAGHASEPSAEPHRAHVDGALLLSDARTQLADRQLERARASVDAALSAQLAPSERAEAMTLRAECALMAGDHAAAVQAYLRVARSFAQLPAGENALFSAARLEMERGRNQEAQRSLQQYLARYPQGRFVKETRLRLRTLGAPSDHAP